MNTTATLKRIFVMVLTIGGLMMGVDSFAHDGKKDRKNKRNHAVQRRDKCEGHHNNRYNGHRYERNDRRYADYRGQKPDRRGNRVNDCGSPTPRYQKRPFWN